MQTGKWGQRGDNTSLQTPLLSTVTDVLLVQILRGTFRIGKQLSKAAAVAVRYLIPKRVIPEKNRANFNMKCKDSEVLEDEAQQQQNEIFKPERLKGAFL